MTFTIISLKPHPHDNFDKTKYYGHTILLTFNKHRITISKLELQPT